jgi:hypothetical protein
MTVDELIEKLSSLSQEERRRLVVVKDQDDDYNLDIQIVVETAPLRRCYPRPAEGWPKPVEDGEIQVLKIW